MKIAVCQLNVLQGDRESNLLNAEQKIDEAVSNGAEIVVLPEMWLSGYDFNHLGRHIEPLDGETSIFLSGKAKEHRIWLIGGSFTADRGDGVYNTSLSFSPSGELINTYSKMHLIGLMHEDQYLRGGLDSPLFDLGSHRASTVICYDIRFPELMRHYAVENASILFVPAQWPIQREEHWKILLRARAIENQFFVVGANVSGRNENDVFNGHSMIINPLGKIIAEAGSEPTILYATIDLDSVSSVRERMPVLKDRKPELYKI
ncbi:Carbon-nitrogen hydrolase [Fictibacillus solisalsi]|uniref:Carbon-nitrogen hydrolase n=1 Tax=Fictibacillus solisalsi TaxID=459525 RepID=A0A1G9ZY81_9BACL|nr:carbon-nitrogen family hydrolase [Fictibacillus solisalsi]SDN25496.1 Carbon-nitrogen hydrolase [Fictibacillus solisalsi]